MSFVFCFNIFGKINNLPQEEWGAEYLSKYVKLYHVHPVLAAQK